MKKLFIISILAIGCVNNLYAAGNCGIGSLNTSTDGRGVLYYGYSCLNSSSGVNESNYGLTRGFGQWAVEFDYGTVWGMAKCSSTSGNHSSYTWPESSKSNWLKTPSDTSGQNCWCQATGFTATASSYTSGPQCTTSASSLWVYTNYYGSSCARDCAGDCASRVRANAAYRAGVFGAVPADVLVGLAWYDNGTTISGASSCTVGGTFVPPTPPARTGYIFAGWKIKEIHVQCSALIKDLDSSINGTDVGYITLDTRGLQLKTNATPYGLTETHTWGVTFDYGKVVGRALCSTTSGSKPNSGTPVATSGKYCWCQATGFIPNSGSSCTVSPVSSTWIYQGNIGASYCPVYCAQYCAQQNSSSGIKVESAFRAAVFNAAGQ